MRTQIGTLVVAASIIQLANGFFGTFVCLRVAIGDFDAAGLVLSAYFAGFTLGALRCGKITERIGHIRAFAAFAGLVAAATAVMPLLVGSLAWVILRAIVGFGCAGIFVTTESWLSAKAVPSERGRVFSIYMVGTFLALALGQLLIARADIKAAGSFNAIVALFAVALVMVTAGPSRVASRERDGRTALWRAHTNGTYRLGGLRIKRARWRHLLRACSGVDAGSGHHTCDHCAVHARGGAWGLRFPKYRWAASLTASTVALCWHCSLSASRSPPLLWFFCRALCRCFCPKLFCLVDSCQRCTPSVSPTRTIACRPIGSWR